MVPNNDKKRTYSVTYVPKVGGLHKVSSLVTSPRPSFCDIPLLPSLQCPLQYPPPHAPCAPGDTPTPWHPPCLRVVAAPPMPHLRGMGDTWHMWGLGFPGRVPKDGTGWPWGVL